MGILRGGEEATRQTRKRNGERDGGSEDAKALAPIRRRESSRAKCGVRPGRGSSRGGRRRHRNATELRPPQRGAKEGERSHFRGRASTEAFSLSARRLKGECFARDTRELGSARARPWAARGHSHRRRPSPASSPTN